MSPIVTAILGFVQIALQIQPVAAKIYEDAKALIKMMFDSGMISIEEQEQLMKWANEHEEATLAGKIPPELEIDADP